MKKIIPLDKNAFANIVNGPTIDNKNSPFIKYCFICQKTFLISY